MYCFYKQTAFDGVHSGPVPHPSIRQTSARRITIQASPNMKLDGAPVPKNICS
jgi:hypothetical protein